MRLRGVAAADGAPADRWEIGPLQRRHRRAGFSCGVQELDEFLRQYARQNSSKDIGRTYVASPLADREDIAGYFTLSAGSVACDGLPASMARSLPRYPVPVVLLGRLAVDVRFRGQGLGEVLLLEALGKARDVAEIAGAAAVQVDAIDENAAAFYERYGFVRMVHAPRTLLLSMKAVRNALG